MASVLLLPALCYASQRCHVSALRDTDQLCDSTDLWLVHVAHRHLAPDLCRLVCTEHRVRLLVLVPHVFHNKRLRVFVPTERTERCFTRPAGLVKPDEINFYTLPGVETYLISLSSS